ncbi:MAG: DUF697 domain-containing protein [bacterium]
MTEEGTDKYTEAMGIVKKHSFLAAIAALSPYPTTDLVGIGGVQVTMLIRLSELFELSAELEEYKNIIIGALDGLITGKFLQGAASMVKWIPVVGTILGDIIQAPIAFCTTYALGRAMIHFCMQGVDITTVDRAELQGQAKGYIQEGKELLKQEGRNIGEKSKDKQYVKEAFEDMKHLLNSFAKGEEFVKELSKLFKGAYETAKKNAELDKILIGQGKEIKEGGKNARNK